MHRECDSERLAILGHLAGEVLVSHPMAIREIGVGGATVETSFPLHIDSLHELRLTLQDGSVVLKGRVVHSSVIDLDQDTVVYRSGLEFVEVPPRVITALADYVAGLKTRRSGA